MLTSLTLDERERLAYSEGYTETAALLAQMSDLERSVEVLEEKLSSELHRVDMLELRTQTLEAERDALADMANFEDQAKTYRAALMALEAEVSPAMREFIREVLQ